VLRVSIYCLVGSVQIVEADLVKTSTIEANKTYFLCLKPITDNAKIAYKY